MTLQPTVVTRWLTLSDWPDVAFILGDSSETGYTPGGLRAICKERGVIAHAALFAGSRRVVGVAAYRIHSDRYHLLCLAVLPGVRRLGVGRALVARLKDKLTRGRRPRITLECDDHNDPAIAAYRALGFRATGLVRDGAGPGRDAIAFEYHICNPAIAWVAGEVDMRAEWEC